MFDISEPIDRNLRPRGYSKKKQYIRSYACKNFPASEIFVIVNFTQSYDTLLRANWIYSNNSYIATVDCLAFYYFLFASCNLAYCAAVVVVQSLCTFDFRNKPQEHSKKD